MSKSQENIVQKLISFALLFALSSAAFSTQAVQAESQETSEAVQFDCAGVKELHLEPGTLFVRLQDGTTSPLASKLAKLQTPACKSVLGAIRVIEAAGKKALWLNGLGFLLVNDISGQADQAALVRKPFSADATNHVEIAAGMFDAYKADELTWVLGHELGHGAHRDADWKAGVKGGSIVAVAVGGLGAIFGKGVAVKAVLGAAAAGGVYTRTCGTSLLTPKQETKADAFGIQVLTQLGLPLERAKSVAVAVFNRHPEVAGKCVSRDNKGFVDTNAHPSTDARITAIQKLK